MVVSVLLLAIPVVGCGTAQPKRLEGLSPQQQALHRQCDGYQIERDPEIELPRPIRRVDPIPARSGPSASVACVAVLVSVEGQAVATEVRYTDNRAFAENAVTALRKWRFEPGTRNGEPVETWMLITISMTRARSEGGL